MKHRIAMTTFVAAAVLSGAVAVPQVAFARHHHRHYYSHARYYGQAQYARRCSSGDGAVGTIAGGAGGALIGRTLDKQYTRHRNGC